MKLKLPPGKWRLASLTTTTPLLMIVSTFGRLCLLILYGINGKLFDHYYIDYISYLILFKIVWHRGRYSVFWIKGKRIFTFTEYQREFFIPIHIFWNLLIATFGLRLELCNALKNKRKLRNFVDFLGKINTFSRFLLVSQSYYW